MQLPGRRGLGHVPLDQLEETSYIERLAHRLREEPGGSRRLDHEGGRRHGNHGDITEVLSPELCCQQLPLVVPSDSFLHGGSVTDTMGRR